MSKLSLSYEKVEAAVWKAAENIKQAAGDDPFISRKDMKEKLKDLSGFEQKLTDVLFRYIAKEAAESRIRVTVSKIDQLVKKALYPFYELDFDLENIGLSMSEIDFFSKDGSLLVLLALYAKRVAFSMDITTSEAIGEVLEELSSGLYLWGYDSEAPESFDVFHEKVNWDRLRPSTFLSYMELDQTKASERIRYWDPTDENFNYDFLEGYEMFDPELLPQARNLLAFMRSTIKDLTVIIIGEYDMSSHPTWWIGIGPDGHLIGLKTLTIYT